MGVEKRRTNSSTSNADVVPKLIEAFVKAPLFTELRSAANHSAQVPLGDYLLNAERASRQARPERAAATWGVESYRDLGPSRCSPDRTIRRCLLCCSCETRDSSSVGTWQGTVNKMVYCSMTGKTRLLSQARPSNKGSASPASASASASALQVIAID